jgi:hypothetical protein
MLLSLFRSATCAYASILRPLLLSFVHFVPRFVLTLIEPIPNAFADLDLYMHCTLAAFAFPVVLVAFSVHYCD